MALQLLLCLLLLLIFCAAAGVNCVVRVTLVDNSTRIVRSFTKRDQFFDSSSHPGVCTNIGSPTCFKDSLSPANRNNSTATAAANEEINTILRSRNSSVDILSRRVRKSHEQLVTIFHISKCGGTLMCSMAQLNGEHALSFSPAVNCKPPDLLLKIKQSTINQTQIIINLPPRDIHGHNVVAGPGTDDDDILRFFPVYPAAGNVTAANNTQSTACNVKMICQKDLQDYYASIFRSSNSKKLTYVALESGFMGQVRARLAMLTAPANFFVTILRHPFIHRVSAHTHFNTAAESVMNLTKWCEVDYRGCVYMDELFTRTFSDSPLAPFPLNDMYYNRAIQTLHAVDLILLQPSACTNFYELICTRLLWCKDPKAMRSTLKDGAATEDEDMPIVRGHMHKMMTEEDKQYIISKTVYDQQLYDHVRQKISPCIADPSAEQEEAEFLHR